MDPITFGLCPICKQGYLIAVKGKNDGTLSLMCEECECQWSSPESAKHYKNVMEDTTQKVIDASLDDVIAAGWIPKND